MIGGAIRFVRARLAEKTTWASLAAAMAAGAMLVPPWSYGAALAAFMTSFIPEKPKAD